MKNKKALIFLLLVAGAVYANSLASGFVWDDNGLIVKKQFFFSQPGSAIKIFTSSDAPFGRENPYYRPINTFTYMADHYLWGLHPFWYHLENVLIHALVVMLFYLLLMEVFEDGRLAFIAALLFAVYPVNAETVDFISARNTLLCAVFTIASLLFLAKNKKILSLSAYSLALLSKEPAVVLPIFLLSMKLTGGPAGWDGKFRIKKDALIGFFGITVFYFFIRHLVLGVFTSESGVSFSLVRLKLISEVYFEHFRLMLFPYHLNALYFGGHAGSGTGEYARVPPFSLFKCAVAVAGVLLLLYISVKKKIPAPMRAGAQWIFWGLLPVSGIVKIPSSPVAERFQYTVIFGFVLILGYLLAGLQKRKALAGAALVSALAFALGARTFTRNFVWHDNVSLYSSMVRSDPGNSLAHCYLGLTYEKQGLLGRAEEECGASQRMDPGYGVADVCLGLVYGKQGRPMEALEAFQRAVKVAPELDDAHMDLAVAYMNENRVADAEREFKTVIWLNPYYTGAHMGLAELYAKENRLPEAEGEFRTVLGQTPDNATAHDGLGLIYAESGNINEAVLEFGKALALDPSLTDARVNLGVAYAKEGRFEYASGEFQEVLKRDPGNARAIEYFQTTEKLLEKK